MKTLCYRRFVWFALVALPLTSSARGQSIATLTGTLKSLVADLTSADYFLESPDLDPRPYVQPSYELPTLYRASRHLMGGDVQEAARLAEQVDYEVVRFVDSESDNEYLVLREDLQRSPTPRGWGAYLLNPNSHSPALVEAPHPIDDTNSADVAAQVFENGARGLLIAGAQRDKADVPDLVDSVFHQVHVAWTSAMGRMAVWQIHGFAIDKHRFPQDTQAVLSTGGGELIDEIVNLNDQLTDRGIQGYAYNDLKANNKLNKWVNRGTPGVRFSSLAATKNEQGKHLRSVGGTFIHVELESEIRASAEKRQIAADAIAEAISKTARDPADGEKKTHTRNSRKAPLRKT